MTTHSIRRARLADEAAAARVWYESGQAEYSYLPDFQALTPETARRVFREVIVPEAQLWVGEACGQVRAFMSLKGSYIDRLYVAPDCQGEGWGGELLAQAKSLQPAGLELHTHQANVRARSFYERRGFLAVKFGISAAPELVPDVEYHWRP